MILIHGNNIGILVGGRGLKFDELHSELEESEFLKIGEFLVAKIKHLMYGVVLVIKEFQEVAFDDF